MTTKASLTELTNAFETDYRLKLAVQKEEDRIKSQKVIDDANLRRDILLGIIGELTPQFARLHAAPITLTRHEEGQVGFNYRGYCGSPLACVRISISLYRDARGELQFNLAYEKAEYPSLAMAPLTYRASFADEASFCVAFANVIGSYLAYYTQPPAPAWHVKPTKSVKRKKK